MTAFRAQLLLLWRSGRVWLLWGVLLLPLLWAQYERIQRGDPSQLNQQWQALAEHSPILLGLIDPLVHLAPLWALAVWFGEPWRGREYHWSMPVGRDAQDLSRVAAGAAWLLAGIALLVPIGFGLAMRDGSIGALVAAGPTAWASLALAPLLMYLLFSIAPVASGRPIVALVVVIGGWLALLTLTDQAGQGWLLALHETVLEGDWSLAAALFDGMELDRAAYLESVGRPVLAPFATESLTRWLGALGIWLTAAFGGIALALRRKP